VAFVALAVLAEAACVAGARVQREAFVATFSNTSPMVVRVWKVNRDGATVVRRLTLEAKGSKSALTDADSNYLAALYGPADQPLSTKRTLRLYDLKTGRKITDVEANGAYRVVFVDRQRICALSDLGGTLTVWDRVPGGALKSPNRLALPSSSIAISADGRSLACLVGKRNFSLKLGPIDGKGANFVRSLSLGSTLYDLQKWSPDSRHVLLASPKKILIVDASMGKPVWESPDYRYIGAATWKDSGSVLWSRSESPNLTIPTVEVHEVDLRTRRISTVRQAAWRDLVPLRGLLNGEVLLVAQCKTPKSLPMPAVVLPTGRVVQLIEDGEVAFAQ